MTIQAIREKDFEQALRKLTKTARRQIRATLESDRRILSGTWYATMADGETCGCLMADGHVAEISKSDEAGEFGASLHKILAKHYRMRAGGQTARLNRAAAAYDAWVGDRLKWHILKGEVPGPILSQRRRLVKVLTDEGKQAVLAILDRIDR